LSCNGLFFGPSLASATPQYTLSGSYAGDKNEFFPNGRDAEAEALLMAALKEGSSKFIICLARNPGGLPECIPNYESLPEHIGGTIEEQLALEYDMGVVAKAFAVSSGHPINQEQLGVVLGRVGLWEEALRAFYEGLKTGRHVVFRGKKHVIPEPGMWGAVGVAAHVLGRYDGSVLAFDKAVALDATYFDTRKIQRKIREASHSGRFVWER
jgi:hypothetical protein